MRTYTATPADRERNWLLVDAEGKTLGRLATQIADALRGKRKPVYTPHVDTDLPLCFSTARLWCAGAGPGARRYHRHERLRAAHRNTRVPAGSAACETTPAGPPGIPVLTRATPVQPPLAARR